MRLLLTGIGGFIGSHVLSHILLNTDWEVVGIDSFRHKGISERITTNKHYRDHRDRVIIYTHDLSAPLSYFLIDQIGYIDYIINMASESHVDRSIDNPVPFVQNNVNLALNMLEYTKIVKPKAYIHISTDESYGPMLNDIPHREWDSIIPSNPYAASKAAQESLSIGWWRTYNIPLILTQAMNNYGEYQDIEKYIPKAIKAISRGEVVTVHGNKDNIGSRYWLHARNHADALIWLLKNTIPSLFPNADRPDRYNIVGEMRINNLEIVEIIADILGMPLRYKLLDFHASRPGHDPHYGLDGTKLQQLGWKPPVDFMDSLKKTIQWYQHHPEWLK